MIDSQLIEKLRIRATLFDSLDERIKALAEQQAALKAELLLAVEMYGEADDKGHLRLPFDSPAGRISALQKQRRTTTGFNEEAAERILNEHGLWDEAHETVRVFSDDKVLAMNYEGRITDDELREIYPFQTSWAFTPVRLKEKKK